MTIKWAFWSSIFWKENYNDNIHSNMHLIVSSFLKRLCRDGLVVHINASLSITYDPYSSKADFFPVKRRFHKTDMTL